MLENNRYLRLPALLLGLFMVVLLSQVPANAAVAAAAEPELPRVSIDTTYSPPAGNTITVNAGDDLQAALDAAQPGDTLSLQAGATFTGNFVLPDKGTDEEWIYVQTSAYSSLPAPGQRVSPANAAVMPKIVSPNTMPAIATQTGAHHYRFVGIEITTTHTSQLVTNTGLVVLGTGDETSVSQLPHNMTFDRNYIHGTLKGNVRRGITANAASVAVVESHISDAHELGADSQAIGAWSSPGPFKIVNNNLQGAGENFLLGGADTNIPNLVPSDIEFRRNHLFKPLSWREGDPSYAGDRWSVKNLFELKNAQRVLVDGNILENNWAQAQNGFGVLFTPRNQDGTNPWAVVQDVTFTRNILRNSDSGFNCSGRDDNATSEWTKRILIKDNVIDSPSSYQGPFRLFQIVNGIEDFTIDHNTAINDDVGTHVIVFDFPTNGTPTTPSANFTYRNNISDRGNFGVFGSGVGEGTPALEFYTRDYEFRRNVIADPDPRVPPIYPPDNFFPATLNDVGFADLAGGDYRLVPPSPYIGQGTDGKDIGADVA